MKVSKSIKLLGVAAVAALSFAGNASAVTVTGTGPNGTTVVVTGVGDGFGTWSVTPAVPEADTWAMMALGLGLVGLRLRRKGGKTSVK
ncbi:PEP-CTERM sorting domain-containing protein [Sulfuriferula thiophila]|uniref:PEP-CTERM sorting domain-containing protein n=1 Tax=Sulfuriferula thiophila TaxID=1781211 RepID=UPI000F60BF06|nr:PEP-CTERM sorting domain-containing protein [Sulfuriferula thiophila]